MHADADVHGREFLICCKVELKKKKKQVIYVNIHQFLSISKDVRALCNAHDISNGCAFDYGIFGDEALPYECSKRMITFSRAYHGIE